MPKKKPRFWWEYAPGTTDAVIVKSDHPGGEELARFTLPEGEHEKNGLEWQIVDAKRLIQDFESGRKTPPWGRKPGTQD